MGFLRFVGLKFIQVMFFHGKVVLFLARSYFFGIFWIFRGLFKLDRGLFELDLLL